MKWIFLVLISFSVSSLCANEIAEIDAVMDENLPHLQLNDIKVNSAEVADSYESTTVTDEEDTAVETSDSAAVLSSDGGALPSGLMALEEGSSDSELKRVKKANTLTTVCVEIKPSSPYEPPYYMCRGTGEQPNSKGNYEPGNYGSMKPPSQGYGYEKPAYSQYEDSSSSGGYARPKPSNNDKPYPAPAGSWNRPTAPSYGGYIKPSGQSGYEESSNPNYGSWGGNQKPIKYPGSYDMPPSMKPKPMKYQEIVNPYFNSPVRPPYGSSAYPPTSPAYGPPASYQSASYSSGKPTTPMYGPSAGYNAGPNEMYQSNSGYTSGKFGWKKPYTTQKNPPKYGYRAGEDEFDNTEMSEQEDLAGPDLQSAYQYGSSAGAGYKPASPSPYTYKAPTPQVPCGSNLLFSCNPNVVPVPCYNSPSYKMSPPPIVYNFPPLQPPPMMYGPPMQQPPLPYYPNLGAAHQGIPPSPGRNVQKTIPESKKDFDSNQPKEQKISEDDEKKFNSSIDNGAQDSPMQNTSNDGKNRQSPDSKLKNSSFSSNRQFDAGQFSRADSMGNMEKGDKKKDENLTEMNAESFQRKDENDEDGGNVKNAEPLMEDLQSATIMKNRQQMQQLQMQQIMNDNMNMRNMQAHPGTGVNGQIVYRNGNW